MKWTEVSRKVIPDTLFLFNGEGSRNYFTYAQVTWEIVEKSEDGNEHRHRQETGKAFYLHEHSDLSLEFTVAALAMERLINACITNDEKKDQQ